MSLMFSSPVCGKKVLEEIKPEKIVLQALADGTKIAAKLLAGEAYAKKRGWVWRVFWYRGR